MIDVFKNDAFSMMSLTTSVNLLPYVPGRLGSLGIFDSQGITTLSVGIEEKGGQLTLIPAAARGTMPNTGSTVRRKLRSLNCVHLPHNDAVMADEVQGVRAFGSETEVETVSGVVNDKLEMLRQAHELTHEYMRCGAIQGVVLDADGVTPLYDLFDVFEIDQIEIEFDFTNPALDFKKKANEVHRALEDALGGMPYTSVHAFCGNQFWDAFVSHESVKGPYERWQVGTAGIPFSLQGNSQRQGFDAFEVTWENYRGKVNGVPFIPTDVCQFIVRGTPPGLFQTKFAPANFVETVNTIGKEVYAKQEEMKFGIGVELHTQSNPLMLCTRPRSLIKGVGVFASGPPTSSSSSP